MNRALLIILLIAYLYPSYVFSKPEVDSLQNILKKADGIEKAEILLKLCFSTRGDSLPLSFDYGLQAKELAISLKNDTLLGKAYIEISKCYYVERDSLNFFNYIEKASLLFKEINNHRLYVSSIFLKGEYLKETGYFSYARKYYQKAEIIALKYNIQQELSKIYNAVGITYYYQSKFDTTIYYLQKSLQIDSVLGQQSSVAKSLNNIGVIYKNIGEYDKALETHLKALSIREEINEANGIAMSYSNIAHVYYYWDKYEKAEEYFNKALEIYRELNDETNIALLNNNLGSIHNEQKEYDTAIKNYEKALTFFEKYNYRQHVATTLDNIGLAYSGLGNFNKAILYHNKSLELQKVLGNKEGIAHSLSNMGNLYKLKKDYTTALNYYNKSLPLIIELNLKQNLVENYKATSEIHEKMGNYKDALSFHKKYTNIKDSLFSEKSFETISELGKKYETEKKEQEIELLSKEKELDQNKLRWQKYITIAFIILSFLIFLAAINWYGRLKIKQKANRLLQKSNNEIKNQRDQIVKAKKNITDSIQYARKIQKALFPPEDAFNECFSEYFIVNKPKDIVSGDFYWIQKKNNKTILAVADCTGHGVPGAFMSSMAISFLNDILGSQEISNPGQILDMLRAKVKASLHQTGRKNEAKDGLDIALMIIDNKTKELAFSGAYNSLHILRNNEFSQLKGDAMPIGISIKKEIPFSNQEFQLEEKDIVYIFTDGIVDQFRGNSFEKFKTRRLKELLKYSSNKPLSVQKVIVEKSFFEWKGEIEQIDDVLVVGFKP